MTAPTSSFDASGAQFVWDSTSLKLAFECQRKYSFKLVEGWGRRSTGPHLRFGAIYATALEHFFKNRVSMSYDEAMVAVVREAMISSWDYATDAEGNAIPGSGSAWVSGHNLKTRENVIRSIVWYLEEFRSDPMPVFTLTDGRPAVEYSFLFEVDNGIMFSGHIDRVVTYSGHPYVMDQKAQPLTTKVLTPSGWKKIADLSVGEQLVGRNGKATELLGLFPKGLTPVYRVYFNDGSFVDCGEDHLWSVDTQFNHGWQTMEMKNLLSAPSYLKFHIPLCSPIQHPIVELPLHPYVLGVLLGDGYLGGNSIQLSTSHEWLAEKVGTMLDGDVIKKSNSDNYVWTISGGKTLAAIRSLGLKDKLSADKFVPEQYLIASEEQRRALLSGLLVTDGSWNGVNRIYDSTSKQLIEAVCSLVRSLGGNARYRERKDGCYRASLRLTEWPAGLGKRYIERIERIEDAETACLKVEAEDELYITENYIVTHNTTGSALSPSYFEAYDTDLQMSMYTLAGKIVYDIPIKGVVVDAAQIGVGFTRYGRHVTTRTEAFLDEWYDNVLEKIEDVRQATVDKKLRARPNYTACGNFGGCEFRRVCSASPEFRQNFLEGDFEKGNPWDPLKRR